jgi:hypothetical protein
MHKHDLPQPRPGKHIEHPVAHRPDRRRSYAAAARCHRGPVADLGGLALADPAGLLAILQSDIPRQDTTADFVRLEYGEAEPLTVAPAAVLAREPPGRVALIGRPGPTLRPAGQRRPDRAFSAASAGMCAACQGRRISAGWRLTAGTRSSGNISPSVMPG